VKILEITQLKIPEIKVVKYGRFADHRGYFTEHYRKSDFFNNKELPIKQNEGFVQANESFSYKNTFRGLHFQWNPYMGKLVRPVTGHLIDFALDIRKNSTTFGKIIAYEMKFKKEDSFGEWIWIPPGFAHGILLLEDSLVEYLCTGEYSQGCEAGISPLSKDIDWSLCNSELKSVFDGIITATEFISDKDKNGLTLADWLENRNSDYFIYGELL
jgi:dTDP-4-dehydrorhamnose 3,5-epimerase